MRTRLATVMLLVVAGTAFAQGGGGGRVGGRGLPGGPPEGGPPPSADMSPQNRVQLEQSVQQRLAQMMKNRLGLNADQMKKLREANNRYDQKRRLLVDQERDIRMSTRDEILRPDSSRGAHVNGLLDRMVKVQRQRVDLLEQEQADLSRFLTPIQRAQYFGLEEQVRRRMQMMRQQQMAGRGGRGMQPMNQDGQPPMVPGMQGPPSGQMLPRMRKRLPPPDTGGVPSARHGAHD